MSVEKTASPRKRLSSGAFQRLSSSTENICNSWFPPNPAVLSLIQEKLSQDQYEEDIDIFLEDLKQDFSLFLYCVGALSKESIRNTSGTEKINPVCLLRGAEFRSLKRILECGAEDISVHSFSSTTKSQGSCLMGSMMGACVSSALCFRSGLHPDIGFSCSLLRQLGYALVAYNYPNVFKRAIQKVKEGIELEDAIATVLGWTPTHLGVAIARDWSIGDEFRLSMGDESVRASTSSEEAEVADVISELCDLGEKFARGLQPDIYPSAFKEWADTKAELRSRLGPDGMQNVRRRIDSYCKAYFDSDCEALKIPVTLEKEEPSQIEREELLMLRSISLDPLKENLKVKMFDFYAQLDVQGATYNVFKKLTGDIIPSAGFSEGCLYLMDYKTKTLTPRVAFCGTNLDELSPVTPEDEDSRSQLIKTAFNSSIIFYGGGSQKSFCCSVGESVKIGVLYLEPDKKLSKEDTEEMQESFIAISNAISYYFSCF